MFVKTAIGCVALLANTGSASLGKFSVALGSTSSSGKGGSSSVKATKSKKVVPVDPIALELSTLEDGPADLPAIEDAPVFAPPRAKSSRGRRGMESVLLFVRFHQPLNAWELSFQRQYPGVAIMRLAEADDDKSDLHALVEFLAPAEAGGTLNPDPFLSAKVLAAMQQSNQCARRPTVMDIMASQSSKSAALVNRVLAFWLSRWVVVFYRQGEPDPTPATLYTPPEIVARDSLKAQIELVSQWMSCPQLLPASSKRTHALDDFMFLSATMAKESEVVSNHQTLEFMVHINLALGWVIDNDVLVAQLVEIAQRYSALASTAMSTNPVLKEVGKYFAAWESNRGNTDRVEDMLQLITEATSNIKAITKLHTLTRHKKYKERWDVNPSSLQSGASKARLGKRKISPQTNRINT